MRFILSIFILLISMQLPLCAVKNDPLSVVEHFFAQKPIYEALLPWVNHDKQVLKLTSQTFKESIDQDERENFSLECTISELRKNPELTQKVAHLVVSAFGWLDHLSATRDYEKRPILSACALNIDDLKIMDVSGLKSLEIDIKDLTTLTQVMRSMVPSSRLYTTIRDIITRESLPAWIATLPAFWDRHMACMKRIEIRIDDPAVAAELSAAFLKHYQENQSIKEACPQLHLAIGCPWKNEESVMSTRDQLIKTYPIFKECTEAMGDLFVVALCQKWNPDEYFALTVAGQAVHEDAQPQILPATNLVVFPNQNDESILANCFIGILMFPKTPDEILAPASRKYQGSVIDHCYEVLNDTPIKLLTLAHIDILVPCFAEIPKKLRRPIFDFIVKKSLIFDVDPDYPDCAKRLQSFNVKIKFLSLFPPDKFDDVYDTLVKQFDAGDLAHESLQPLAMALRGVPRSERLSVLLPLRRFTNKFIRMSQHQELYLARCFLRVKPENREAFIRDAVQFGQDTADRYSGDRSPLFAFIALRSLATPAQVALIRPAIDSFVEFSSLRGVENWIKLFIKLTDEKYKDHREKLIRALTQFMFVSKKSPVGFDIARSILTMKPDRALSVLGALNDGLSGHSFNYPISYWSSSGTIDPETMMMSMTNHVSLSVSYGEE